MVEQTKNSCISSNSIIFCLGSIMTILTILATLLHILFWLGHSSRSHIDFMDVMFPLVGFIIYVTNLSFYCFVWCQSCCKSLNKSIDYSIIFVCIVILYSLLNGLLSRDSLLQAFFYFYAFLNLLFMIIACMMKRESQRNLEEIADDEPDEQEPEYTGSYSKDAIPKFPIPIYMQKTGYTREIDGPIYL